MSLSLMAREESMSSHLSSWRFIISTFEAHLALVFLRMTVLGSSLPRTEV